MKNVLVLEFITSFGGVQSVYKNILPELAKENRIFFLNPYSVSDDLGIGQFENIEIVNMPLRSPKSLGWKKGILQRLLVCFKYFLPYFTYLFKIVGLCKQEKIDLMYVSGKKEFLFALLLKYFCNVPYIYHAHGFGKVEDINWLTKLAIRKSKYTVCVSRDVQNKIIKSGICSDRVLVVHNGLNLDEASEKLGRAKQGCINNEAFTVAFAGTIQPQKGVLTLVKAIMHLRESGCDIRLHLIGNCNGAEYAEQIREIALEDAVSFCGFSENIYEHFLTADVVVLPSREESFGMVLLEGMYAQKPVIGSDIGGIPDIIVDGQTGYLFSCDDALDLAEKIKKLYDDNNLAQNFGQNGFARVCNLFSSEKQAGAIGALIND